MLCRQLCTVIFTKLTDCSVHCDCFFFECSDTVGWVTGRAFILCKTVAPAVPEASSVEDLLQPSLNWSDLWKKYQLNKNSLTLCFNSHYSKWTWVSRYQNVSILDFVGAKDDGGDGDSCSCQSCKAPDKLSPTEQQQTNTRFFTGQIPFLSPNQQCQSVRAFV